MTQKQIYTIEIKGGKELIKFAKKLDPKETLLNLRNILGNKISDNIIFTKPEDIEILKDDENEYIIEDIIDRNIIHMKNIEDRFKSDIDIYLNDSFKLKIKLMKFEKLNNIRNIINDTITKNGVFLYKDGIEILKEDESEYSLEDILDGNKMNIKISNNYINNRNNLSNQQQNNFDDLQPANSVINFNESTNINTNSSNIVLEGSSLIEENGELKIYQYPKIEFTEEEKQKAIKIMVIGPTGTGKTTLLNSYINCLMDIEYGDNFRYKIIDQIKKINDSHS